jgi:2-C-methyl-D-erythritol 2,4-cyclodiphosphate synthase
MNTHIRVGIGYDLHRFAQGRGLFLGGVKIPFSKGLLGHSDADVLFHAICDAILGACGQADIGVHFPDTDPRFRGISGSNLARQTRAIVEKDKDVEIINIDTVVICDKPDISGYKQAMTECIAGIFDIGIERVNIKAKTTEGTSRDTVSSYAVVLAGIKNKGRSC